MQGFLKEKKKKTPQNEWTDRLRQCFEKSFDAIDILILTLWWSQLESGTCWYLPSSLTGLMCRMWWHLPYQHQTQLLSCIATSHAHKWEMFAQNEGRGATPPPTKTKPRIEIEFVWTHSHRDYKDTCRFPYRARCNRRQREGLRNGDAGSTSCSSTQFCSSFG